MTSPEDMPRSDLVRRLRNLHVGHRSPDAGMCRWVRDFTRNDPFCDNLVLESIGRPGFPIMEFHLRDGSGRLIDNLFLRFPIDSDEASHPEYRGLIEAIWRTHSIAHLYVSSMIGHGPALFDLGVPVTFVHHDQRLCRELRDRCLLASAPGQAAHVAPSHTLAQTMGEADPCCREIPFIVIENGVDAAPDCFGGAAEGRRLRLAVVGDLELNQGAGLLSQSFEALRLIADLYLVGSSDCGRYFLNRWGVTVIGSDREVERMKVLREISPDMGLLLSMEPHDRNGYDLSELQVRGIPPVATRQGSYCERISHGRDGFLFPPDARALASLLVHLDARREELRAVARRLRCHPPPDVRQMIYRYYSLRQDLPRELDRMLEGHRQVELHL